MRTIAILFGIFLVAISADGQDSTLTLGKKTKKYADRLATSSSVITELDGDGPADYEHFKSVATTNELVLLTDDSNPIIRVYAFRALADRNYSKIQEIFYRHKLDTVRRYDITPGSCIMMKLGVNQFMLDNLHPVGSKCKFKFTKEEFDRLFDEVWKTNQD